MTDRDQIIRREDTRAQAAGKITPEGLRHGSADGHRAMIPDPKARTRCPCCGKRASHVGLGDGMALMGGCEWRVRRWVKRGFE